MDALREHGFTVHDYGKMARPGRKLGHITTVASSAADRDRRLAEALKILGNC
jgi:phosphoribosylaminoimidazole carboxylase (NCAIR synthetase)